MKNPSTSLVEFKNHNHCLSNKIWIVNPTNEFKIIEGPSLNKARANHNSAEMTLYGKLLKFQKDLGV